MTQSFAFWSDLRGDAEVDSTAVPGLSTGRAERIQFALGPAPIAYEYGRSAHAWARSIIAASAGAVHLLLGIAWEWKTGYLLAAMTLVSVFVVIPFTRRMRAFTVFLGDLATIGTGLILLDAVAAVPAWGSLFLVFISVYLPGRAAVWAALITVVALLGIAATSWVWDPFTPLTEAQVNIYVLLILVLAAVFMVMMVLAAGAAMRAREEELNQRRELESRLRHQMTIADRRMQAISEFSPVGLSLQDARGKFLVVNRRLTEIFGRSAETIVEQGVVGCVAPAQLLLVEQALEHARKTGATVTNEYEIRRPDGTRRWIEHTFVPLFDDTGAQVAATSTVLDRSDEIRARQETEILSRAADSALGFLAVWRPDGRFLFLNQAVVEFFGIRGPYRGLRLHELEMDVAVETLPVGFLSGLERDGRVEGELEFRRKDGSRIPYTVAVSTATDGMGEVFVVGIGRDVSEQRSVSQRLEELLAAKDEFVASISHELRTPLTAVVGLAREMSERIHDFTPDEAAELAQLVAEQSTDVSSIVEDLLTSARMDAGTLRLQLSTVDLHDAVHRALDSVASSLSTRVRLDGDRLAARGDRGRIRQIVRNLLTNAGRYGGLEIELRLTRTDAAAIIEVRDSGDPIDEAVRARMFEPYGRGHDVDGVTDSVGLGLSVSRELAQLMGGDITYTHDGSWSVFALSLPDATSELVHAAASGAEDQLRN